MKTVDKEKTITYN